jgi:hypothetical protein
MIGLCVRPNGQGVVSRQASCRPELAVSTGEFYIFVETVADRRSRCRSTFKLSLLNFHLAPAAAD